MTNQHSDSIASALTALEIEERDLKQQIAALQQRLTDVRAAIVPIRKLVGNTQEEIAFIQPMDFTQLSLPRAMHQYLLARGIPMSAPEISRDLLAGGFKTESENFTNLVGTTLRRSEGRLFDRDKDGLWRAIRMATSTEP
jgi:hypothetical protein